MRVCQFRHIRNEVDLLIVEEQARRCQCVYWARRVLSQHLTR